MTITVPALEPGDVDMEEVARLLVQRGIPDAYVEQTGGNTATIVAGPGLVTFEGEPRWAMMAGPGIFLGPHWTIARGHLDDFAVGADDDGDDRSACVEVPNNATDEQIVDLCMARMVTVYADRVAAALAADIEAGLIPANVRAYPADLHGYGDGNAYTIKASVPWGAEIATDDDPGGLRVATLVENEVTRRLAAAGRYCTPDTCKFKGHDHTTIVDREGMDLDAPVSMLCNDCGLPTHYVERLGWYCHDDPDADPCFLTMDEHGA